MNKAVPVGALRLAGAVVAAVVFRRDSPDCRSLGAFPGMQLAQVASGFSFMPEKATQNLRQQTGESCADKL